MADGSGSTTERQPPAASPGPSVITGSHVAATYAGPYRRSLLQGLGIFSVSLGAVLLLFLTGMLVADRALANAARRQTEADASEVATQLETFITTRALRLRAFRGLFLTDKAVTSTDASILARDLGPTSAGFQRLWVADSTGLIVFDTTFVDVPGATATQDDHTGLIERARTTGRLQISQPRQQASGNPALTLVEPLVDRNRAIGFVGSTVLASSLPIDTRGELQQTRIGIAVLSGRDTVITSGKPVESAAQRAQRRVPSVPQWHVEVAHSESSRYIRFALWSLGILAVTFLAAGLQRERRQAEDMAKRSAQLEQLYREVRDASRIKSEFLANVSHELRTPLNAIVGFVEMLRDGVYGELGPRQGQPVERIAASASHLRHLVDQVLDIAKMAAGRLEVHPEPIVLRPFVLNIVSELESLINEKGLTLSITVGATLPRVRTDPTHLRQIIVNLVGNAVKYTMTGGISVRTRLVPSTASTSKANDSLPRPTVAPRDSSRVEEEGSLASIAALTARAPRPDRPWLALQVSDTGIGIAPEDQERIFEEFEQVNAGPRGDSMRRGTGLGLAISRRLARLLGAELTVESELGRGSTFTLWLPIDPADLEARRTPTTSLLATKA